MFKATFLKHLKTPFQIQVHKDGTTQSIAPYYPGWGSICTRHPQPPGAGGGLSRHCLRRPSRLRPSDYFKLMPCEIEMLCSVFSKDGALLDFKAF